MHDDANTPIFAPVPHQRISDQVQRKQSTSVFKSARNSMDKKEFNLNLNLNPAVHKVKNLIAMQKQKDGTMTSQLQTTQLQMSSSMNSFMNKPI